jgi:hypothetical protein
LQQVGNLNIETSPGPVIFCSQFRGILPQRHVPQSHRAGVPNMASFGSDLSDGEDEERNAGRRSTSPGLPASDAGSAEEVADVAPATTCRAATDLLNRAKSGLLYVTSQTDAAALNRLATELAASTSTSPIWPDDAETLCGSWKLLATTDPTQDGPVLPIMSQQPDKFGSCEVRQDFIRDAADPTKLRCENTVTIGRPSNSLLSAWTFLAVGGVSSLILRNRAEVVQSSQPLRIELELDGVTLDGNRKPEDAPEEILSLLSAGPGNFALRGTLPWGGIGELKLLAPPLPRALLGEVGVVEVVYLDENMRVTRDADEVLRVFERAR